MTTLPTCNQPDDNDPGRPCPNTTVHGTDRCIVHVEPGTAPGSYSGPYTSAGNAWSTPQPDAVRPVHVPARAYDDEQPASGFFAGRAGQPTLGDLAPELHSLPYPWGRKPAFGPPTPEEVREIADSLNAHGGFDETFVAALLRQAVADEPLNAAHAALGVPRSAADTTAPVTTEPGPDVAQHLLDTIHEWLGKLPPPLKSIKLTPEQLATVQRNTPPPEPFAPDRSLWGVPIELVETIEESTPHQLAQPLGIDPLTHARRQLGVVSDTPPSALAKPRPPEESALGMGPGIRCRSKLIAVTNPYGGESSVAERLVLNGAPADEPPQWLAEADQEFVDHVNDGVDKAAVLAAVQVAARRPWWRRALDRVRRWER